MTDDMQRVLELVRGAAVEARNVCEEVARLMGGSPRTDWNPFIGHLSDAIDREAARSASGGAEDCQHPEGQIINMGGWPRYCDHCKKYLPLAAAPAPAETTALKYCDCFGDSGLHASTHRTDGGIRCDLCGYPIHPESTDVLSAINQETQPVTNSEMAAARGPTGDGAEFPQQAIRVAPDKRSSGESPSDGPSPVPTPPDAAQGKPHIHDWQRLGPNPGDGWACECGNSRLDSDLHTTTGESGFTSEETERLGHILHHGSDGGMRDSSIVHKLRLMLNTRSTPRAMEGDDIGALIVRLRAEALADEKYMSEGCDHRDSDLWKAADFLARLTRLSTATQADGGTK